METYKLLTEIDEKIHRIDSKIDRLKEYKDGNYSFGVFSEYKIMSIAGDRIPNLNPIVIECGDIVMIDAIVNYMTTKRDELQTEKVKLLNSRRMYEPVPAKEKSLIDKLMALFPER